MPKKTEPAMDDSGIAVEAEAFPANDEWPVPITREIVVDYVRKAEAAGDLPGVHILKANRNEKTNVIAGSGNYFHQGRVTILIIEE